MPGQLAIKSQTGIQMPLTITGQPQHVCEIRTEGEGGREKGRGSVSVRAVAADKPANAQMQFGLALSTLRETPASLQIIAFARHSIQTLPARLDTPPALSPALSLPLCHSLSLHAQGLSIACTHSALNQIERARQMSSNLEKS